MAKSNASGLLTSLDSLFTTQEQRDAAKRDVVLDLPLDQIGDFPNHPFKVRQDEAMMEMMESVQLHGVLVPGLVRQLADGSYQMVSGHRRKLASRLAGLDTLPCIVRDLTDDEAIIVMVDSNLQREKVLPSEKAFAYRMKLEAMRRQGKRTDLTSTPVVEKLKGKDALSSAIIGKAAGDSYEQVRRYIRLTYLLPEILAMVDDSKIAFRPAVELSYLAEKEQRILYDAMGHADCTPSLAQAIKMKSFSREGKLSEAVIRSIMAEEKPNQKEQFRIPKERISKYFKPGTPARTMGKWQKMRKITGFRALYLYYCYKLGVFPKRRPQNRARLHFLLREDLIKLNNISQEVRLLARHHIDTAEQLALYKKEQEVQITTLSAQRRALQKALRTKFVRDSPEQADAHRAQIKELSERLKALRREVHLCNDIAERSGVMAEKLKAVREDEKNQQKEEQQHEHIR